MAIYSPTTSINAKNGLDKKSAAIRENAISVIKTSVAMNRPFSNIFFNCLTGPVKKNVLKCSIFVTFLDSFFLKKIHFIYSDRL